MYQISEKWYGVLICDCQKQLDDSMKPFLADLCKMIDDAEAPDYFGDGTDDRPVRLGISLEDYMPEDGSVMLNDLWEVISDSDILNTSYSGGGDPPYGIAVEIESYPSWEVQNIIQSEKNNESQRADAEIKFQEYCDKHKADGIDFIALFEKHGIQPDFVWTSSTS